MDFKTEDGRIVDYSKLFDMLGEWFDAEMYDVYRSSYRRYGLMLGAPLWGDKHIGIFGRFCLASMMAKANREALAGSTIVLFTRRQDLHSIASIKHRLSTAGIDLMVYLIPDAILEEAAKNIGGHYWILGVVHQLIAKMAGWAGMGFHMLLPDHIFNAEYFPNLLKLIHLHEAIAQTSMSVSFLAIKDIEEQGRQSDGTLSLTGRQLGDIGLQHLHQQMRPMILNGKDIETSMPSTTTWLAWRGKDALSIYSPHMNVAYLSARVCLAAPARIPHTMDTELPNYMREGFYVPTADDGLCFIEISDNHKEGYPAPLTWDLFASTYWQRIRWQDKHLPFARTRGEVPLSHDPNGMEIEEIEAAQNAIMDRLIADKGRVTSAVLEETNQ